ncbi:hypothetical protein GA0115241_101741 [Streptomyces sp. DpondAA-D4]|nr:hypothetical protein GA0115241_101741 [Streptomyces sp. DpondAA-D4]
MNEINIPETDSAGWTNNIAAPAPSHGPLSGARWPALTDSRAGPGVLGAPHCRELRGAGRSPPGQQVMKPFSTSSCAGWALPVRSADLCGPGRRLGRGCRRDLQGLSFIDAEAVEALDRLRGVPRGALLALRSPFRPRTRLSRRRSPRSASGAAGISDTLVLGLLCEPYGPGTPTAALLYVNSAQGAHPAYAEPAETAHDGHPDQLLRTPPPEGGRRGRPISLGGSTRPAYPQGGCAGVIRVVDNKEAPDRRPGAFSWSG